MWCPCCGNKCEGHNKPPLITERGIEVIKSQSLQIKKTPLLPIELLEVFFILVCVLGILICTYLEWSSIRGQP